VADGANVPTSTTSSRGAAAGAIRMRALTEGPIGPTLIRLALPNIAFAIISTAAMVMDTFYVGQLGVAPLAALALVFPMQTLMQMISSGAIGGGISSAVARAMGAGDIARAERVMAHALVIALAFAVLFTILFGLFARPIFALLGGRGLALDGAVGYASIVFGGAVIIFVSNTFASILRGTGNIAVPAACLIGTALLGMIVSGAFTLGWFGLPSLGVIGPAIAAIAMAAIAGTIMFAYLASGAAGLRLRFSGIVFSRAIFHDILKVGLVASGNATLTIVTIIVITGLVGRYGTEALAGYGLGSRLELILIPIAFGVGGALTAMVGASFGAKRYERARRAAFAGGAAVFAFTALLGGTVAIFPDLWIGLFTTDPGATEIARRYLHVAGTCYAFFGMGMTLYFASQGTGSMVWPFTAGVARLAVAAGGGALAALVFGASLDTLFAFVATGLVLFGSIVALSLKSRVWNPEKS
jgi:putative MATE family efflux protein